MVALDHGLIARTRELITGTNVRRAEELIYVYEQAVVLHNNGAAKHVVYRQQHEQELRQFTEREAERRAVAELPHSERYLHLDELNQVVMRHAFEVMEKFARAEKHCEELGERVKAALLFCQTNKKGRKEIA